LESEALLRPIVLDVTEGGKGGVDGEGVGAEAKEKGTEEKGPVAVPETVIHGTYFAFWPGIVESGGLRVMGRQHVHCSTGLPEEGREVVSGMRRDAELLVYIDVERSIREGEMKWWMSENGVVLTEGVEEGGVSGLVPSRFFKRVVGRKKDVGVLWEDGQKKGDLPADLKVVVPVGKGGRGGRGGRRGR
jgi:2'-phosphotransferase